MSTPLPTKEEEEKAEEKSNYETGGKVLALHA